MCDDPQGALVRSGPVGSVEFKRGDHGETGRAPLLSVMATNSREQLIADLVAASLISSLKRGVLTNIPRMSGSAYTWL